MVVAAVAISRSRVFYPWSNLGSYRLRQALNLGCSRLQVVSQWTNDQEILFIVFSHLMNGNGVREYVNVIHRSFTLEGEGTTLRSLTVCARDNLRRGRWVLVLMIVSCVGVRPPWCFWRAGIVAMMGLLHCLTFGGKYLVGLSFLFHMWGLFPVLTLFTCCPLFCSLTITEGRVFVKHGSDGRWKHPIIIRGG